MPRVAIFLCNNETMGQCLELQLFGTQAAYGLHVQHGDFLLLYNFSQNSVFGVWIATTDGGNFIPRAWRGGFPNQVRIQQIGDDISCVTRNQIPLLGNIEMIGRIYEGPEAETLLQHFRPAPERSRPRQTSSVETPKPSRPVENRALQQTEPDYLLLPPKFFCEDTDRVRSQGEKIIDDCLFRFGVRHVYEPQIAIQGGQIIPDFVVYSRSGKPIYIEYWGKLNEQDYDKRRREKTRLYRENNLPLIQIVPDDLKVIKFVLEKELEKWDVAFRKPKGGLVDFLVQILHRIFCVFRRPH